MFREMPSSVQFAGGGGLISTGWGQLPHWWL